MTERKRERVPGQDRGGGSGGWCYCAWLWVGLTKGFMEAPPPGLLAAAEPRGNRKWNMILRMSSMLRAASASALQGKRR